MPTAIDLWPDVALPNTVTTPLSILKDQAIALGNKTKNVLEGEVRTIASESYKTLEQMEQGSYFIHRFFIKAPALDNYRYELFRAEHTVLLYPVRVILSSANPEPIEESSDEAVFIDTLRDILGSDKTKQVIQSLLNPSIGLSYAVMMPA